MDAQPSGPQWRGVNPAVRPWRSDAVRALVALGRQAEGRRLETTVAAPVVQALAAKSA